MTESAGNEPATERNNFADEASREYPSSLLPLSNSPFYLPNLIAALIASVCIVVGSIGPWAAIPTMDIGGVERDRWGVVTLVIGAAAAVALFVQSNWGRTNFSLRWAVPLVWAVLVAGVGCLAIAVANIVTLMSLRSEFDVGPFVQVGWGLWLVVVSSAVLCLTAPIVAAQVGKAASAEPSKLPEPWLGGWRWAAVIASGIILLVAMATAYKPIIFGGDTTQAATTTVVAPAETVTAAYPMPRYSEPQPRPRTVPAGAKACPSKFTDSELPASAVGTDMTSCEFAEAIRRTYLTQPGRTGVVELYVASPKTGLNYTVTCSGSAPVRCTGGDNAVVYLF